MLVNKPYSKIQTDASTSVSVGHHRTQSRELLLLPLLPLLPGKRSPSQRPHAHKPTRGIRPERAAALLRAHVLVCCAAMRGWVAGFINLKGGTAAMGPPAAAHGPTRRHTCCGRGPGLDGGRGAHEAKEPCAHVREAEAVGNDGRQRPASLLSAPLLLRADCGARGAGRGGEREGG